MGQTIDVAIICRSSSDFPGLCRVATMLQSAKLNTAFFYSDKIGGCNKAIDKSDFSYLEIESNVEAAKNVKAVLGNDGIGNVLRYFTQAKSIVYNHAFPSNAGDYTIKALGSYGQWAGIYDYYLLTGFIGPEINIDELASWFSKVYPARFVQDVFGIEHKDSLTFIPTGYLRLDNYVRLFQEHKDGAAPKSLLFAPGFSSQVAGNHFDSHRKLLDLLVRKFPDYTVVYRPFPQDASSDAVADIVRRFDGVANFTYDTSSNAAEDYWKYVSLVTDHSEIYITFSLATGRKSVRLSRVQPGVVQDDFGFSVGTIDEALASVRAIANNPHQASCAARKRLYAQTPDTEKHFSEVVARIVHGKPSADWISVPTEPNMDIEWENTFQVLQDVVTGLLQRDHKYPIERILGIISVTRADDVYVQAFYAYIQSLFDRPFKDQLLKAMRLPGGHEVLTHLPFAPNKLIDIIYEFFEAQGR